MADSFDPYHIWLGIPPTEQPADHYRLLGISRFESNLDVISNAADQRVRHVRSMQTGKRQGESQRLLNEIAAATGVLLDDDKRKGYDAQLRAKEASSAALQEPRQAAPAKRIPVAGPIATSHIALKWVILAGVVGVCSAVVLVGITLAIWRPWTRPPDKSVAGLGNSQNQKGIANSATSTARVVKTRRKAYPMPTNWEESSLLPEQRMPAWAFKYAWDGETNNLPAETSMMTLAGSFTAHPSGPGCLATSGGQDSAEFLFLPPPVYRMIVHVKREKGAGPLAIDFPAGGRQCRMVIDSRTSAGFRSGLEMVDGKPLSTRSDSTLFDGELLLDQTRSVIVISVGPQGIFASITQENDEFWNFSKFEGDLKRVGRDDKNSTFVPISNGHIGITTSDGVFVLQGIIVTGGGKPPQVAANSGQKTPPRPKSIPVPNPKSPVPTSLANPEHKNDWEYGYGRVDGSGRVMDFRPMVYSVMTEADGTKSVLWGTEPVYSAASPLSFMGIQRDGGHSCHDPQVVVVRRWRCPDNAYVKVQGEVQHASAQGDGIRAHLVTSTGRNVWSSAVRNSTATIATDEFLVLPNDTVDFYVDCHADPTFDQFKCHLALDVRYTRRGREPKTDRWDSIVDYRDPPSPASGSLQVQAESGKATARFVRIELPGKAKFLQLAEVEVYSGSENVAVKGNATQSSTAYDGSAKLANDGNTNGHYFDSKSVSHTNLEDNPWWEVDLGMEKVLDKIVVWSRTDDGDALLQGYKVLALDASRNVIWQVSPPEYPKPSSEFAPSGISRGIPGGAENLRLGEPVPAAAPMPPPTSPATAGSTTAAKSPESPPAARATSNLPIPTAAELAMAHEKLREAFGDFEEMPERKGYWAREFIAASGGEKDPSLCYVMLDTARFLAVDSQDLKLALEAVQKMYRKFQIDDLQLHLDTHKLASGKSMPLEKWEEFARSAIMLSRTAVSNSRSDIAEEGSQIAVEFAAKGRSQDLRNEARQSHDLAIEYKKSEELFKEATQKLANDPNDGEANLFLGKWYSFIQRDFTKGLPHLAKGGEPLLAAAARAEQQPGIKEIAVADAWFEAGGKLLGSERIAALKHSREFYGRARANSGGLEQLRAGKREAEVGEAIKAAEKGKTGLSSTKAGKSK